MYIHMYGGDWWGVRFEGDYQPGQFSGITADPPTRQSSMRSLRLPGIHPSGVTRGTTPDLALTPPEVASNAQTAETQSSGPSGASGGLFVGEEGKLGDRDHGNDGQTSGEGSEMEFPGAAIGTRPSRDGLGRLKEDQGDVVPLQHPRPQLTVQVYTDQKKNPERRNTVLFTLSFWHFFLQCDKLNFFLL